MSGMRKEISKSNRKSKEKLENGPQNGNLRGGKDIEGRVSISGSEAAIRECGDGAKVGRLVFHPLLLLYWVIQHIRLMAPV